MDLVTVILSCAFASVEPGLLQGVAQQVSGVRPLSVREQGDREARVYADKPAAAAAIEALEQGETQAYVGVMGVPMSVARDYGWEAKRLLEPCDNVRLASAMLAELVAECRAESVADTAGCSLARYGRAIGFPGEAFAEAVLLAATLTTSSEADGHIAETLAEPIVFDTDAANTAGDSLFFKLNLDVAATQTAVKTAKNLSETR